MSRRDDAQAKLRPAPGQGELIEAAEVVRVTARVEAAVKAAVEAAAKGGQLVEADKGMAALAVELGLAVDVAMRIRDPYAAAAAGRELRETLTRLGLDPSGRQGADDKLRDLLDKVGQPS